MEKEIIIKALECCPEQEYCGDCPYDNECMGMEFLILDALSLIKELTEENESRKQTIDQLGKNNDEIARVYPLAIKEAKDDTVRKMQERLKMHFGTYILSYKIPLNEVLKVINQVAKEMLEEGK